MSDQTTNNAEETIASEQSPELWNPAAAANWSLLFTPMLGAIVHMKNWETLGDASAVKKSKIWAIIAAVVFVASVVMLEKPAPVILLVTIAWYIESARKQMAFVKSKWGTTYTRRSWRVPLGVAAILYGVFILGIYVGASDSVDTSALTESIDSSNTETCINQLRMIDSAKEQIAMEKDLNDGDKVKMKDVIKYAGVDDLECPDGGKYTIGTIGESPECSIEGHSLD